MQTLTRRLLISFALLSLTSASLAMGPPWAERQQGRDAFLIQELNLSAEQQKQFQKLRQEQREQAMQWRAQRQKIMQEKMQSLLTEEQLEKFKTIKVYKQFRQFERKMRASEKRPNCGNKRRMY
jgi:Spy/CpxP family protein refolding chaperone